MFKKKKKLYQVYFAFLSGPLFIVFFFAVIFICEGYNKNHQGILKIELKIDFSFI